MLALLALSRRGALPLGKIGVRLMVHPASVTNAVDRLAAAGLVRRVPHPTDGRAVLAEITDDGRELVARATKVAGGDPLRDGGPSPTATADRLTDTVTALRTGVDFDPADGRRRAAADADPPPDGGHPCGHR